MSECTTHHSACDCREDKFAKLLILVTIYEDALKRIADEDYRGNRSAASVAAFNTLKRAKELDKEFDTLVKAKITKENLP